MSWGSSDGRCAIEYAIAGMQLRQQMEKWRVNRLLARATYMDWKACGVKKQRLTKAKQTSQWSSSFTSPHPHRRQPVNQHPALKLRRVVGGCSNFYIHGGGQALSAPPFPFVITPMFIVIGTPTSGVAWASSWSMLVAVRTTLQRVLHVSRSKLSLC
jgi:hypothetical protein